MFSEIGSIVLPAFDFKSEARFTPANRKAMYLLQVTLESLFLKHDIRRIAFATLTFPEKVCETKAASRRLNSFLNWLRKMNWKYAWVRQRHANRGIHYHLVLVTNEDIRTGTDLQFLEEAKTIREKYAALSPSARTLYRAFRRAARKHGFGRSEAVPIYKNADAIRNYSMREVKGTWYHGRWPEMKGQRWWGTSKSLRSGNSKFSWNSPSFRQMCAEFCRLAGYENEDDMRQGLGNKYIYRAIEWDKNGRGEIPYRFLSAKAKAQRAAA